MKENPVDAMDTKSLTQNQETKETSHHLCTDISSNSSPTLSRVKSDPKFLQVLFYFQWGNMNTPFIEIMRATTLPLLYVPVILNYSNMISNSYPPPISFIFLTSSPSHSDLANMMKLKNSYFSQKKLTRTIYSQPLGRKHIPPSLLPCVWPLLGRIRVIWQRKKIKHHKHWFQKYH